MIKFREQETVYFMVLAIVPMNLTPVIVAKDGLEQNAIPPFVQEKTVLVMDNVSHHLPFLVAVVLMDGQVQIVPHLYLKISLMMKCHPVKEMDLTPSIPTN